MVNVAQLPRHLKLINRRLQGLSILLLDLLSVHTRVEINALQLLHATVDPLVHAGRRTCRFLIHLLFYASVDIVQVSVGQTATAAVAVVLGEVASLQIG